MTKHLPIPVLSDPVAVVFDLDGPLYDPHDGMMPYEDARKVLPILRQAGYRLSLVTKADATKPDEWMRQWEKLQMCGLISCFRHVSIVFTAEEKMLRLREMKTTGEKCYARPMRTVVVGDRIDEEITFANVLKFVPVRIRRGKYKDHEPVGREQKAKFNIYDLYELLPILKKIEENDPK